MALKPGYLVLAGAGVLVGISGLKGWSLSTAFRDMISGKNPSANAVLTAQITGQTYPGGTAGYGFGYGGYGYGGGGGTSGTNIPPLPDGTTLPPQAIMNKYFGPIDSPMHETVIRFAGHFVTINRAIAGNLKAAGIAIEQAGLAGEIRDVGGFRTTKGASGGFIPYSMHQYGAAIDINEDGGPNGYWNTMTLDPRLVAIMARFHWFCGEHWSGASRDGGHFQFTGG